MIDIKNLIYHYEEHTAIDDISLNIKENERIVLLGNNGCGKSTLLKIISALLFTNEGSYFYKGDKIDKKSFKKIEASFRKEVGILFQNPDTMLFNPTVYEEIAFGLRELDISLEDQKIKECAKIFEIEHLLNRSPLQLSGGEKQKVAFAAIFALQPKLLLLDEPTANMDPRSTGWLVDFLSDQKITSIITTHNLSLAQEFGERAIVMDATHKIIYDGPIKDLLNNKSLLLKANLMHKHRHNHDGKEHSHFHIHDWS